jgi:hypothetical protein
MSEYTLPCLNLSLDIILKVHKIEIRFNMKKISMKQTLKFHNSDSKENKKIPAERLLRAFESHPSCTRYISGSTSALVKIENPVFCKRGFINMRSQ